MLQRANAAGQEVAVLEGITLDAVSLEVDLMNSAC